MKKNRNNDDEKRKGRGSRQRVGGTGGGRKEQVLRSWKILKTGSDFASRSRLAHGHGTADKLMASPVPPAPFILGIDLFDN